MQCYDFEYSGKCLSDFGFIICKFDSKGVETVSNGSTITFNTVSTLNGMKHELTSSKYDKCLEATFQICKHSCADGIQEISMIETREIMRWLNRKGFHKFKLLDEDYVDIFFEASFNVSKIEINGKVYGFELSMVTNRPFAVHNPVFVEIDNIEENGVKVVSSNSDEEGYIYPEMEIVVKQDCDLSIVNEAENRETSIANCVANEIITFNYPIIQTSNSNHKIQNDFNWVFFRLSNSFDSKLNKLIISHPCTIKIKYYPIIKVSI